MARAGVLLHVRHLETKDWERLMWGEPEHDRLGSLPMLVWLLLTEPQDNPVGTIVMGCSPAVKDGLSESAYTKRFFLEHFDRLGDFPRLKELLRQLSPGQTKQLRERIEHTVETPLIRNTMEELMTAAKIFTNAHISSVTQVTSASHAPRCVQVQSYARATGIIPPDQLWSVVADDMCYADSDPLTTLILEKPHRGDDPHAQHRTQRP